MTTREDLQKFKLLLASMRSEGEEDYFGTNVVVARRLFNFQARDLRVRCYLKGNLPLQGTPCAIRAQLFSL